MKEWHKLSQELAWRAATYGRYVHMAAAKKEGVLRFDTLAAMQYDAKGTNPWWWIYQPLLEHLLRGGRESKALWACVGHHTGSASAQDRQWLYFFSDDFTENDVQRALFPLSYNASFPALSRETIVVTTTLLEILQNKTQLKDEGSPLLYPSVITLSGFPFEWPNNETERFRAFNIDWRPLRALIEKNAAQAPFLGLDLVRSFDDFKANEIIPFLGGDSIQSATLSNYTSEYHESLINRAALISKDYPIRDLLGSTWRFFETLPDERLQFRVINGLYCYIIWMHDLLPQQKWRDWSHIVTIPAWLPAERGGSSGSMIVCLRNNKWLTGAKEHDLSEMGDFISTFRTASIGIAAESKEYEMDDMKDSISHELGSLCKFIDLRTPPTVIEMVKIYFSYILILPSKATIIPDGSFPREGHINDIMNYWIDLACYMEALEQYSSEAFRDIEGLVAEYKTQCRNRINLVYSSLIDPSKQFNDNTEITLVFVTLLFLISMRNALKNTTANLETILVMIFPDKIRISNPILTVKTKRDKEPGSGRSLRTWLREWCKHESQINSEVIFNELGVNLLERQEKQFWIERHNYNLWLTSFPIPGRLFTGDR